MSSRKASRSSPWSSEPQPAGDDHPLPGRRGPGPRPVQPAHPLKQKRLDILVFAYLVLRSAFLPRTIGVLLAVDGLAYLCYSFTDTLAPDAAAHLVPWR